MKHPLILVALLAGCPLAVSPPATPPPDPAPAAAGPMGFAALSVKGRALRYLAQREHSRAELERKLRIHEEEPGQLAQVLDELQAKDFISEARVVQSVLHQRAPRMGAARVPRTNTRNW